MRIWLLIGLIALAVPMTAAEPVRKDAEDIRDTVLDYVRSRYEGSPDLMRAVLHPDVVKRVVGSDVEGTTFVIHEGLDKIVAGTRYPFGREKEQLQQVEILDVTDRAATVKVTMRGVVDYLHLVKINRAQPNQEGADFHEPTIVTKSWRIVHILEVLND